jgi:hypothetical protein
MRAATTPQTVARNAESAAAEAMPSLGSVMPYGLLLADMGWMSCTRCSPRRKMGAATSSALELSVEGL